MDLNAESWILKIEGGYVNHPSDPGGETNHGISKRAYPDIDIAALTERQALDIYQQDYWSEGRCNELLPDVALVHFDACVNSGIRNASKWLQAACGATVDGVIGPNTLKAVQGIAPSKLVQGMLTARLGFYAGLNKPDFERGWFRRVLALQHYVDTGRLVW